MDIRQENVDGPGEEREEGKGGSWPQWLEQVPGRDAHAVGVRRQQTGECDPTWGGKRSTPGTEPGFKWGRWSRTLGVPSPVPELGRRETAQPVTVWPCLLTPYLFRPQVPSEVRAVGRGPPLGQVLHSDGVGAPPLPGEAGPQQPGRGLGSRQALLP